MISVLKLLANLQNWESFIDVVCGGIKDGRRRKMVGLGQVAEPVSRGERSGWLCVLHEEVQSQGKTRRRRAHSERERENGSEGIRGHHHDRDKWELSTVDSGWSALRQTMHERDVAKQVGIRSVGGHHHPGGGGGSHVMKWIVETMRFPPVCTLQFRGSRSR